MKRRRYPRLPVPEGKARQMLSTALMLRDDAQAAWIDRAVKAGQIVGRPEAIEDLKRRLDEVMQPNQPP